MSLASVHLISSDETLLVQEARDALIKRARKAGFSGHEYHTVDRSFKWDQLYSATHAISMFDDKSIIELRMPTGKPGTPGSKALVNYCAQPVSDKLLLIITGKLEAATKKSKWFKAVESAGKAEIIWPIDLQRMPAWVEQRLREAELQTDRAGVKLIIDATEGNLLATAQEIEKLRLLHGAGKLSADQIADAISDNARFDVFKLVDSLHGGSAAHSLRVLSRLRQEGAEPTLIVWAIARELRTLINIKFALQQGTAGALAMKQNGVWDKRQPLIKQSLKRHSLDTLKQTLRQCETIDLTIKGLNKANVWDELSQVVLRWAN